MSDILDKAVAELNDSGIKLDDPQQLRAWLDQAEGILVSQLLEGRA